MNGLIIDIFAGGGGSSTENCTNDVADINVGMTTTEAINILEHIEADIYGRIAIGKAIDALKGETHE